MAGVTTTGFSSRALADILDELNADTEAALSTVPGNPLNLTAASAIGQVNGIMAAQLADLWDLAQAVYSSFDPNAATGDALSNLAQLTGTLKRNATFSVANGVTVNVNPGTYAAGALVASVAGTPASTFSNLTAVTNSGGSAANFTVAFQATAAGSVVAPAGTLTVIAQPVTGWNSVTNPSDAVVGLPIETDPELRTRRVSELQGAGATSIDAIRSDILQNLGTAAGGDVLSCTVLGNDTSATDANGLPPHSIECIVRGLVGGSANDQLVANQIFASKAAGDQATGTTTKTVNDSQGNPYNIGLTRPAVVPIYVSITVAHDPTLPTPAATDIQNAILAYGNALPVGGTVIIKRIEAAAFSVPGVLDVTALTIGTAPSPSGTVNIPIAIRQIATFNSANISVTVA